MGAAQRRTVQIGTPDQAIRTADQKRRPRSAPEFNQQLKRNEPKPGSSIKRYERAIILIDGKSRQEEGHEHVVDVKKMETET
jgi:hypothetical protein